jgi:hypothetical protein
MQKPPNVGTQALRLADFAVHTEQGRPTEVSARQTEVTPQDRPQLDANALWYEMQSRWLTEALGVPVKIHGQAEDPMHSSPAHFRASQDVSIDIAPAVKVSVVEQLQRGPKQRIQCFLRSPD